ncbi:MAG: hypothetical protein HYZ33_03775, partial [Ignavibacteriales bacterium]|nr:hypothetical protein [Ignavibacteriales bacterium]
MKHYLLIIWFSLFSLLVTPATNWSQLVQRTTQYNIAHNWSVTPQAPGGPAITNVIGMHYAHTFVNELVNRAPSCAAFNANPVGQPIGWGGYAMDMPGVVLNPPWIVVTNNAIPVNYGMLAVPQAGTGENPVVFTSTTGVACASTAIANNSFKIEPWVPAGPVVGRTIAFGTTTAVAGPDGSSGAYAFSHTRTDIRSGPPLLVGIGAWVWDANLQTENDYGSSSANARGERDFLRDPIDFHIKNLTTGAETTGTLFKLDIVKNSNDT